MDIYYAVYGGSDPKAAADLPADDAGVYQLLHATPQQPALLRFRAIARGSTSHATGLPASLPTLDGVSPTTAADLPADIPTVDGAGPTATASFPADRPAVALDLHGPL